MNVSNTHVHAADKNVSDQKHTEKRSVIYPRGYYRGIYAARGCKNHHEASCFFLEKIELILKCLSKQPKITIEFHKGYHTKND